MAAKGSGLEDLLGRRQVLKIWLASLSKDIDELPKVLPNDRKVYYQDLLAKWYGDMKALQESTALLCESDEEFEKLMKDFEPLRQSYHDNVAKLSQSNAGESSLPAPPVLNPDRDNVVTIQYDGKPEKLTAIQSQRMQVGGHINMDFYEPPNPLAGERIYFNIRGASPSFFGRKSEMEELTSAFRNAVSGPGQKSNMTNTIILHGIPGSGKTSLTAAFVNECKEELKDFHILWISAESTQSIRDQFVQACEISFPALPIRDEQGQLDEQLMSVVYNQITRNPVLIIFDNAASANKAYGIEDEIADFFCKSLQPGAHQPVYLIITRTGTPEVWKGCNANMIPLGSFNEEDCWNFMKKELPVLAKYKDECRRLWEFFDRLPVAIAQALSVMTYEASFCDDEADYDPRKFICMALEFQPASN